MARVDRPCEPLGSKHQNLLRALWRRVAPLVLSVLSIALFTAPLLAFNRSVATSLVPITYLIPVIFAATRWGIWPAVVASVTAMAAADFFFFAPLYSFRVDNPEEAVDILLFLIVSLVSSNLASRLRQETEHLRQREKEIHALYNFSRKLASCFTVTDLIAAVREHFERAFGRPATFLVTTADEHSEPPDARLAPLIVRTAAAEMNAGTGPMSRTLLDDHRKELWLLRAISSDASVHGVIAVNVGFGSQDIATRTRTRRIESILDETAVTLQRLDIGKAMESARLNLQAQLLRDAFHGTLSHELCSPLAAIHGSASVLESIPVVRADPTIRSLVEAISEESAQLGGYIRNLLSATRVTADGLCPRLEWSDPRDVVNGAVKLRAQRLAAHEITLTMADNLPLLHIDSGLIEEALGQILENAAKYSPSATTISIEVTANAGNVVVTVSDQGVGITPDEKGKLGHRSFRSARHQASVPGSGLGFWIASTFIQAHHGTISVQSRGQGKGTTVTLVLPAGDASSLQSPALIDE